MIRWIAVLALCLSPLQAAQDLDEVLTQADKLFDDAKVGYELGKFKASVEELTAAGFKLEEARAKYQAVQEVGKGDRKEYAVDKLKNVLQLEKLLKEARLTLSGQPADPVPAAQGEGLVGYWKLDESEGNRAVDSSGQGNHGTFVGGPEPTSDVPTLKFANPRSRKFVQGRSQSVQIPDAPSLRLTGDMTVAFWKRKTAPVKDWTRIVGKGNGAQRNFGVWDSPEGGGQIKVQMYNVGGASVLELDSPAGTPMNTWVHIAFTISGRSASLFINGELVTSATRTGEPGTSADPLTFGYAGYHSPWVGQLDEVRIYNRALPESAIRVLASAQESAGREEAARAPVDPSAVIPGLAAHCYTGDNFDAHANTHVDAAVDFQFNAPGQQPSAWPGGPTEHFSVRWVGYVRATEAGKHLFLTMSDDGVRFSIDEAPIIVDWTPHYPRQGSAFRDLTPGWHRIQLEYYQGVGGAIIQLYWQPPSASAPVIIPATAFGHLTADTNPAAATAKAAPPPAPAIVKRPVPEAAQQRDAEKVIRDIFKPEYAKTTAADRSALVQKLIKQAAASASDPVALYVLLREARDVASAAGDVEAAFRVLDEMGKNFLIDAAAEKTALLLKLEPAAKSPDAAKRLAERFLELADQVAAADDYEGALKLAAKADALVKIAKDAPLALRSKERTQELQALKRDADGVKTALATLGAKPDDPAANLVVGRFYGLGKGDWDKALPALAKGSDPALKLAAEKDLANPTELAKQLEAGDSWWDLAEKEKNARAKANLLARVRTWYEAAKPGLTGLVRVKVEQRLAAAGTGSPSKGAPSAPLSSKVDAAKLDEAVQKAVDYLKGQAEAARTRHVHVNIQLQNTEIALLTLLKCGVSEGDPAVQALFKDMMERKLEGTYPVSLQAVILEELDRVKYQWRIAQCAQWLLDNQAQNGQWSYGSPSPVAESMPSGDARLDPANLDRTRAKKILKKITVRKSSSSGATGDASNSIYAAFALRACWDSGILLPKDALASAEKSWRDQQKHEKGANAAGWCYGSHADHKAYGSMTAGALSSLMIYDYMKDPRNSWKRDSDVQEGINWLSKNYSVTFNPGPYEHARGEMNSPNQYPYYMAKLESAGVLFGTEMLGGHDWYAEGVAALLNAQLGNGTWGAGLPDTCMALLFLRKATRPFDPIGK